MKILLAVDGSECSLAAVDYLIKSAALYREAPTVELLTVHAPLPHPAGSGLVLGHKQFEDYYREEGEKWQAAAKARLAAAGIAYTPHILVGGVAECVAEAAKSHGCDMIMMGTHGRGAAGRMLLGSAATAVTHLAPVPVLLVK
jgi:nucleotide-binding universal stress UspA family protein